MDARGRALTIRHPDFGAIEMRALLGVTLIVGLGAGLLFATGCASSGQAATDKQEKRTLT